MPSANASSYPLPPVRPPHWNSLNPSTIASTVEAGLAKSTALLDSIAALPKDQRTFDTVVRPYALRSGEADRELEPALFLNYVHPDKETREASIAADKKVNEWSLDALTRLDVYEALLDAEKHTKEKGVKLNPEEERLLERLILERKRNGLGLSEEKRKEYLDLKKRIMQLEIDFQKNCNEEKGFLLFSREELEGVPEEVVKGFEEVDGKLKVTHKTPDYVPIITYASLPSTRKRMVLSYENKLIQNAPLLKEIVELRHQAAKMLGYESHAAWTLEVKMAKTPSEVDSFLADLEEKLRPLGLAEREKLLELKKEEHKKRGWEEDGEFWLWDYRYYDRLYTETHLKLDNNLVKEYFPVSRVIPAVLGIYKDLLGVQLVPVPKNEEAGGETWFDQAEVDAYAVWESGKVGEEGKFLGYMYLDLFPRENKYGHAAVWGLIPGWTNKEGGREYPVVCMVANLAKSTGDKPATMRHDDVVTFFHEMGHAYHGLLSKTQFSKFHGTAVSRDFVEAPSQMLENWCWTPAQLKYISSHYERNEPLPQDLIDKIIESRKINQGLFNLRQLFFGKYDMLLHTSKHNLSADEMSEFWCSLREKTSLVTIGKEVVGGQSGFAHIAGGYSAGYYGYLYSQVFSADMFETVFSKDPMNADAGRRYREKILQVGGSRDEMDSLVDFLGRKPSNDAFLKSLLG